jgi:thiamine pyrophosphate-dependent acetolactate synthase large subunit-like protein
MGVPGKRITHPEEIQPAVTAALTLGTPYVLEVVTEGGVPAQ